ncbi:MAG: hypothetical protein WDA12_03855 [Bacilli bacterium]
MKKNIEKQDNGGGLMVDNIEIYKAILEYEKEFLDNGYNGDLTKTTSFTYIKGTIPILLSAPHSVQNFRNGKYKSAELLTGGLVKILHQLTGCHIIYKNKNDGYDFNYDKKGTANDYKNKIINIIDKEQIKLFFDIHGMSEDKFLDIDLGTDFDNNLNNYNSMPMIIKTIFEKQEIRNIGFDQIFTAKGTRTITKNTSLKTKIPSVQMEINKLYRDVENPENIIKLINALENIVTHFKDKNMSQKDL